MRPPIALSSIRVWAASAVPIELAGRRALGADRLDLADDELEQLHAAVGAALDPVRLAGADRLEVEDARQRADDLVGLGARTGRSS